MDWDDLRYFLAVAREGQMLGAARRLGVSQALLSRHISELEKTLDTRLLDRTTRGCQLTQDGQSLLATAESVEEEILSGMSLLRGQDEVSGTVRIGTPDGFGSAFLAPRLSQFKELYPQLRVQLVPMPRSFSLSEREADLAVIVGRPDKGRLHVRKLVDYGLSLYATKSYLEMHGSPKSLATLKDHTLVGYVEDLIYSDELQYTRSILSDWRSDVEISTVIGQFEAVLSGVGIGILHDFMAQKHENLVRLFPDKGLRRTYWIVRHENQRASRRVKAVIEMIENMVRVDRRIF